MEKTVRNYHLKDSQQYENEQKYWRSKTPEERLMVLEAIRETWHRINPEADESNQGFRRAIRIIKPE